MLQPKDIDWLNGWKNKTCIGYPGDPDSKESAYKAGNPGSIPESGRTPGERHGNPLQYSCLESLMDKGAWLATVHRVAKSQTQLKRLSMHVQSHLKANF